MSSVSQNVLKFYQQLTGEERRIPFIFDDFHFCRSRVIGLDMTENRIFTLCHMITWVVFLRMFWNFISSLPVKRGGSLSFLVGTISNVLVMEIGLTDVGSGGYILVSCAHSNTSCACPNPDPGFQMSYVMIFFCVQRFEVRGVSSFYFILMELSTITVVNFLFILKSVLVYYISCW
jgi:hypothetical protein